MGSGLAASPRPGITSVAAYRAAVSKSAASQTFPLIRTATLKLSQSYRIFRSEVVLGSGAYNRRRGRACKFIARTGGQAGSRPIPVHRRRAYARADAG